MKHQHDQQIRELFTAGKKFREISAATGLSEAQVYTRHRTLGLPRRRGHNTHLDGPGASMRLLVAMAQCIGRVEFDEADLPNGGSGYIAFINSAPGMACVTKRAALRSAIAAARKSGE